MLYYFFRFLEELGIPGSGMWSCISFRSLGAFMQALLLSWKLGKWFIAYMVSHRNMFEEEIRRIC